MQIGDVLRSAGHFGDRVGARHVFAHDEEAAGAQARIALVHECPALRASAIASL
ncbi:hypothetical protein D3C83_143310 [compost metagenome]